MLELRNLEKSYGPLVAVDGLTLTVPQGQTLALLGPNGSGKTTTLKCVTGLVRPDKGEIWLDGQRLEESNAELRRRISYLPQRVDFPETLTGAEILEFYCRLRGLPGGSWVALWEETGLLPEDALDRQAREYSLGMKQRLGILVALVPRAPVLLLDEPTISLDPEGARIFRQLLQRLRAASTTIVFSSHVLGEVEQLADAVAILAEGRLVALESISSLRRQLAELARMKVWLEKPHPEAVQAACQAGATEVRWEGQALVIACAVDDRLAILEAIERAGGQIRRFAIDEPPLEEIYVRYVGTASNDPASARELVGGLPERPAPTRGD